MVERLPAPGDLDAVFGALSDPTRRAIVTRLAARDASVSALAEPFAISLPAVAKHIDVLERAGLVVHQRIGRERRCHLVATPMRAADEWLARYRLFWLNQLDALERHVSRRPEAP